MTRTNKRTRKANPFLDSPEGQKVFQDVVGKNGVPSKEFLDGAKNKQALKDILGDGTNQSKRFLK